MTIAGNWGEKVTPAYASTSPRNGWRKKPSRFISSFLPFPRGHMPEPFRTQRRVEFADTDMAGIVHFANFFRYMEAAEVEFLRSRGLSVAMIWDGQKIG